MNTAQCQLYQLCRLSSNITFNLHKNRLAVPGKMILIRLTIHLITAMETAIPFFRNRERVRGKDNEYPKLKNANEISMFDVGH